LWTALTTSRPMRPAAPIRRMGIMRLFILTDEARFLTSGASYSMGAKYY
jgi:hypothetical protein